MDAGSAITFPPKVGRRVHRREAGGRRMAIVRAMVWLLLPAGAQAQTPSCDDFKAVLAARFESKGVRGYSMQVVPAATPVPSGASVIGSCESGAYKVLYRRWGEAAAASVASAPRAKTVAPDAPARQASSAPIERAPRALRASLPAPTLQTGARAVDAASSGQGPSREPAPTPAVTASEVAAARTAAQSVVVQQASPQADEGRGSEAPLARRVLDFAVAHWPWFAALLLLLAVARIWRAFFSPYDKDGLPRGPRL
jgi:Protein of unknown function (DUF1161)